MSRAGENAPMLTLASRLRGCGTALVTPFTASGAVDEGALRALVEWQIAEGVHFLVPCGSTGEASTLSRWERQRVVAVVAEQSNGRVPVVAGAGSSDTREAVRLSRLMVSAGATHLLHSSPAYVKPPQRGIVAHFRAISEGVDAPIVLYNVPSRTASNVEAETTLEIASLPGIVAVKEASGNLAQIRQILRHRPPALSVLSGDDVMTRDVIAAGGDGVISVVSNAAPRLMSCLVECCLAGASDEAQRLHDELAPMLRAVSLESNPIATKALLAAMGRIENVLRLPLVPLDESLADEVRSCALATGAFA